MSKNVALAYCAENQRTAQQIDRQLSPASYRFQHFPCSRTTVESALSDQLIELDIPILLVISDNFLKSAQCMSHALRLLQKKGQQLLAVVIDGEQTEEDGTVAYTQTNFDRVSDIIQYINYWQDRYLDLRRQKRQIDEADERRFNEHLKIMRDISSEVGEFLRVLRNSNYVTWEDFAENNFESFFGFQNDQTGWERYQNLASQPETPTTIAADTPEETVPDIDIEAIPGMELLHDSPNDFPQTTAPLEEEAESPVKETSEPVADEAEALAPIEEEETAEETETTPGTPEFADSTEEEEQIVDIPLELSTEPDQEIAEPIEEAMGGIVVEDEDEVEDEVEVEDEDEVEVEVEDEDENIAEPAARIVSEARVKEIIENAEQFFATQQIDQGFTLLENALSQLPDATDLRYHYALSLAQLKDDFSAASSQLETILEIDPDNRDAHFLIGKIAEINENYDSAVAHYEKTAQLNGTHDDIDFQLGMLLAKHYPHRRQEAATYLKKALKTQPDNPEITYSYGVLLHEQLGKFKKAKKYLQKTIELEPDHPFAHYDLALIYHQLDKPEKAFDAYQQAIAINPELQTLENDEAFALEAPVETKSAPPEIVPDEEITEETLLKASLEADTIEALKQNIYRLEEMVKAKAQREEEERAARARAAQFPTPKDEVVFITGASSGIGRATAEKFAANGYKLILNGRRIDKLESLKQELEAAYHSEILLLPFDVRDVEAVQATVDSLEGRWAQIDILINNAGKAKGLDPIHEGKLEHWEEMIDTNLKGLLYLTRAIAPSMVERQSGHIINICSTAGKEVYPKGNVYCATKYAVDALTKAMRIDLHPYNIRVSQVSPGHVEETEFAVVRFDGDTEKAKIYEDFLPLTSKDVAEALFFIANQPKHVNIQDILMMGTQQASSLFVNRSGREALED